MTHLRNLILFILTSTFFCSTGFAEQEQSQLERSFLVGFSMGNSNNVSMADRSGNFELENSGFASNLYIGMEFNQVWRVSLGSLSVQDVEFGGLFSGNDLDISGTFLMADYRFISEGGKLYGRPKAGILSWKGEAKEESEFLFIDFIDGEGVRFENSGTSLLLGVEAGYSFNDFIEWSFIGYEKNITGDLEFDRIYSALNIYF